MYASTEQQNRERVQALAEELYRERFHYLRRIALRNGASAPACAGSSPTRAAW